MLRSGYWVLTLTAAALLAGCARRDDTLRATAEPPPDTGAFSAMDVPKRPTKERVIVVPLAGESPPQHVVPGDELVVPPPMPTPLSPDLRVEGAEDLGSCDVPPEVLKRAWGRWTQVFEESEAQAIRMSSLNLMIINDEGRLEKVYVRALLGENGQVQHIGDFAEISGLGTAVNEAALQWRFSPALRDGKPIRVWIQFPVRFRQ